MKDAKNVAKKEKNQEKNEEIAHIGPIMDYKTAAVLLIMVIQGVMAVENDEFERPLDPDAESLAYKMQNFLRSKEGNLLQPVRIKGNKAKYYWSFMEKAFVLIHGDSELYLVPWKETKKGELYVYSPYNFQQGNVFMVPKGEIIYLGFN